MSDGTLASAIGPNSTTEAYERKLGGVTYKLAGNPGEYQLARKLIRDEKVVVGRLSFPTIIALKNKELIGMLGTTIKNQTPFAGPLVVKSDRARPFTVIRLLDSYDAVMRMVGVKAYAFFIDREGEHLVQHIKELFNLDPYAETSDGWYFTRRL